MRVFTILTRAAEQEDAPHDSGTLTIDPAAGSWSFETSNRELERELLEVQQRKTLLLRGAFDHEGAIYETAEPVAPGDPRFETALRDHLRTETESVYDLQPKLGAG